MNNNFASVTCIFKCLNPAAMRKQPENLNSHWIFQFFIMFCPIWKTQTMRNMLFDKQLEGHTNHWMHFESWCSNLGSNHVGSQKSVQSSNLQRIESKKLKKKKIFWQKNFALLKKGIHEEISSQLWVRWPHKNVKIYIAFNILMRNVGSLKMFWLQKVGAECSESIKFKLEIICPKLKQSSENWYFVATTPYALWFFTDASMQKKY